MSHLRNTEGLQRHSQEKHTSTTAKAEQAIKQLLKEGKPISFESVAKAAGISKSWLYNQLDNPETGEPGLKSRIEQLRDQAKGKPSLSKVQSQKGENSKAAMIKTVLERNKKLEAVNQKLRKQIEVITGQTLQIPELKRQIAALTAQNNQLRQQVTEQGKLPLLEQAESGTLDLKQLVSQAGVKWNATIAKQVAAATREDIHRAIAALKEQQARGKVKNPNGYFVDALRDATWQPNQDSEQNSEHNLFNQWFPLAQRLNLAIASQKIEGMQYVILPDQTQMLFSDMLETYPVTDLQEILESLGK